MNVITRDNKSEEEKTNVNDMKNLLLQDLDQGIVRGEQQQTWNLSPTTLKDTLTNELDQLKKSDKIKQPSDPIDQETESSFEEFSSVSGFSCHQSNPMDDEVDLINFRDLTDNDNSNSDLDEDSSEKKNEKKEDPSLFLFFLFF